VTEYSCKPAPSSGETAFIVTIDFDHKRWIGDRWQRGLRGLYRMPWSASGHITLDADHLLSAIASLEALALRERPTTEKLAS